MADKTLRIKSTVLDALQEYMLALDVERFRETRRVERVSQSEAIEELLRGVKPRQLRISLHRQL